jgi:SNF2 family DNA or RNA helicase
MTNLLSVQKAALEASTGHEGFGYFMEMGLGKTLTTLADFIQLVEHGEATRLVVICPNSFKNGWNAEIEKHGMNVEPHLYESGGWNDGFLRKSFNRPPVAIINYEAIRRKYTFDWIAHFVSERKAMIAFDESIMLKNNKAQQTQSGIELAKMFKFQRILSGKPITQGPHDLWGQLRAIRKLDGFNYYAFRGWFCRMGGYMNRKVVGAMNEDKLADLINPHVFRAKKVDWLDLPPKLYTTREYDLSPNQRAQYKMMENDFVTWFNENEYVTVEIALTKYIKLAQIQFGFIIDDYGKVHQLVDPGNNPRINALKDIIETEVVGKVVVVYHHQYAGIVLMRALAEYNPTFIRGGMEGGEIADNTNIFNNDPSCRVICIQTEAGKYGHTLVGSSKAEDRCSTMVFAENTWSLNTRSQLEDRIHRIGQTGDSCLYIDLAGTPLDRRIVNALQMKESVFNAVFQHIRGRSPSVDQAELAV